MTRPTACSGSSSWRAEAGSARSCATPRKLASGQARKRPGQTSASAVRSAAHSPPTLSGKEVILRKTPQLTGRLPTSANSRPASLQQSYNRMFCTCSAHHSDTAANCTKSAFGASWIRTARRIRRSSPLSATCSLPHNYAVTQCPVFGMSGRRRRVDLPPANVRSNGSARCIRGSAPHDIGHTQTRLLSNWCAPR
jgi:hypothetical protein